MSPAFISIYKMNRDISVPRAHDFCREKNIPFNSEENNFYRIKQSEKRFKNYSQTVNKCFETARPSEMATAASVFTQKGKNRNLNSTNKLNTLGHEIWIQKLEYEQ